MIQCMLTVENHHKIGMGTVQWTEKETVKSVSSYLLYLKDNVKEIFSVFSQFVKFSLSALLKQVIFQSKKEPQ